MKFLKQEIQNEKGIVLIWFYLLVVLLLASTASIYALSFQESQLLHMDQARNKAFYLAEAGIDDMLQTLRTTGDPGPLPIPGTLGGGNYSVTYDANRGIVESTGTSPVGNDQITKIIRAKVELITPPGIKAPITSNSDVSLTGNIAIDGRNHVYNADTGQWEVSGAGTYGVSSTGIVMQGGSSMIGGNGIAPTAFPDSTPAIEQNTTSIYADPTNPTPEEALGLAPGSLDNDTSVKRRAPEPGESGIFYLTSDWIGAQFGTEDNPTTGVLILHNADGDATLKNANGGYFKGLIIADDVIHLNGTLNVIGGIVLNNSSGNTLGNGGADVKYSETVLSNLPTSQFEIISWEDTQNTPYNYS